MKYSTASYLLLIFPLFIFGCQPSPPTPNQEMREQPASDGQGVPVSEENADVAYVKYPMLPDSILRKMLEECDNLEVIFNDLPISMNPRGQAACHTHLEHLAGLPASLHPKSAPAARIFYQSRGNELLQADMYYDDQTTAFVFLKDNQPKWSNEMSEKGQSFYKNLVGMMKQAKDQLNAPQ